MKIIVGADAWGVELKDTVKQHLAKHGHEVTDIGGTPGNQRPYYDVAKEAARMLQAGAAERAVLVCGTGMGMAIVANKFKGVYASVIESEFTARMCRAVNNANVLTMGSMVVAPTWRFRPSTRSSRLSTPRGWKTSRTSSTPPWSPSGKSSRKPSPGENGLNQSAGASRRPRGYALTADAILFTFRRAPGGPVPKSCGWDGHLHSAEARARDRDT